MPGCGAGHDVVELASRGFEVTAVDLAPAALKRLEEALGEKGLKANLVQANVLEWIPPSPVDGVFEQTCFCALDPEYWPAYAKQLHAWLRPAGSLKASFMQTGREGGPPYDCPLDQMHHYFDSSEWQWPKEPATRVEHPKDAIYELSVELIRR